MVELTSFLCCQYGIVGTGTGTLDNTVLFVFPSSVLMVVMAVLRGTDVLVWLMIGGSGGNVVILLPLWEGVHG
jgi:hypothetical protein